MPWLVHLDKLFNSGGLTLQSGTLERADLAGRDTAGVWHVLESKGRSAPPSAMLLTKAKNQVARVQTIDGQPPGTKSASISHLYEDPIRVELVDPDADQRKAVIVEISEKEYFLTYYALLHQLLDLSDTESFTIDNLPFTVSRFDLTGATVGIGLANSIRDNPGNAPLIADAIRALDERHKESERVSIGLDGVIAVLL